MKCCLYKVAIIALSLIALSPELKARETAGELLVKAPRQVMELLDSIERLDMRDYYNSGSSTPTKNVVGGEARVLSESADNIVFQATDNSQYQLSILDHSKKSYIMLIETVNLGALPDSKLSFYSLDWTGVYKVSSFINLPVLKDWLTVEGEKNIDEVKRFLPFMMATYAYDPAVQVLTMTNNMEAYYTKADVEKLQAWIKPSLVYQWHAGRFRLVK